MGEISSHSEAWRVALLAVEAQQAERALAEEFAALPAVSSLGEDPD